MSVSVHGDFQTNQGLAADDALTLEVRFKRATLLM